MQSKRSLRRFQPQTTVQPQGYVGTSSQQARKTCSKPVDRAPASPLHHHALDRSSASIDLQTPTTKPSPAGGAAERRSFKASPASRARAGARTSSELQAQLTLVQEELRNAREHLASVENDRAQILDDLAVAKRLAADAHGKLEESLLARRRAEEALELERFKSTEREQSAIDAAAAHRRTEDEWRRKYDGVARRHAEDVASLVATARELDAVRDELAATARARDSALNRADALQGIADGSAKKAKELEEMLAGAEQEASEYKERFLETSRRLDAATEEACELHAAIDGLRSELQLLHEAHQQAVGAEKAASAQVGHVTEDKNRLLRELADTREERDKAKKAVEDLAAALREVSSEAREAKERMLAKQAELEDARIQMSELKAAMKNAEERYMLRIEESNNVTAGLRRTVERMGSEAKIISKDDMLNRPDDGISSIQLEMDRLTKSLRAAENQVQELRADKTQLLSKLQEFEVQARNTEDEEAKAESSQLKDLLLSKDKELLALSHELTELRLRESAALEKATEVSTLLEEMTARKAEVLESLRAAEGEAKAAKEEKVQLQSKLRQLESRITEASLSSEEATISSLRLKETLEGKESELASIVQENRELRAREAAAHAKIDELAVLLGEATTARKGGELANGAAAAVARSPEKQPSVLLKLNCSPMQHDVQDDDNNGEIILTPKEDIKHVEVETVRQVKQHEKESSVSPSEVDANSLENRKIIEDDQLPKERDEDSEPSDDDDIESTGDDALVDQMNGLLIHGPTSSSFNRDQRVQKKKRALLKKFGSLLKKKAHFTKLSSHSHS